VSSKLENFVDGFIDFNLPQQFGGKPASIKCTRDMSRETNLEPVPPLNAHACGHLRHLNVPLILLLRVSALLQQESGCTDTRKNKQTNHCKA
jgi:hypothetical protein